MNFFSQPLVAKSHYTPVYDALAYLLPRVMPTYLQQGWLSLDSASPLRTFQSGVTPFSTAPQVFGVGALYLGTIFGVQKLMSHFKIPPQPLKGPFLLHNIALALGSGILLMLMLEEIIPIWYKHGFFFAICNEASWTSRMEFFYIINYMFKFWELIDTMFLVLKKKPLAFLHVYHHSATALLCFSQLLGKTSVSWVVITLNLFVHVVMYSYYALTTLKIKVPFKRAVTTLQILQFIIDLGVVYYASYHYFAGAYFPSSKTQCAAKEEHAVISGCAILTSYLFLFIAFYRRTYKKKANSTRSLNASLIQGEKQNSVGKATSTAYLASISGDAKLRPTTPQLEKGGS
ncbi:hypothetical protein CBS101457_006452 [Exobasidium rhododendri]|nr:hypothetical protein CBS101457_006452 [Exobasidium rhododendri]